MDKWTAIQIGCVTLFTAVAMATDLRHRRIPNWLTVSSALLGLVFHGATQGWQGIGQSLGGFAVGFGILLVLWLIGGGGGGDVKLMGAIGAWLGPKYTFGVFVLSVFFAIICTGVVIAIGALRNANTKNKSTNLLKKTIPYALPCALSTWSVLFVMFLLSQR